MAILTLSAGVARRISEELKQLGQDIAKAIAGQYASDLLVPLQMAKGLKNGWHGSSMLGVVITGSSGRRAKSLGWRAAAPTLYFKS
jgi:hypothetical protein